MSGFLAALVIFGGSVFAFVGFGFPETARRFVRSGSLEANGKGEDLVETLTRKDQD